MENLNDGVGKLTQSMGEHLCDAIIPIQKKGKEKSKRFHKSVEKVTANHCKKYDFEIDSVMPELLNWKNDHVNRALAKGHASEWDASAMAYPYCAFLYALRNSWSHPYGRPRTLTNRIKFEFCPPKVDELVSKFEFINIPPPI